ncbi:hypothetical protein DTO013E5_742 [Penicillium roqueforti]|uniref:DUF676 domain-containing protein n=1 Tax=Penicillium roqueforti (strain FM164) TaxID=1365484 RepID=W6QX62_PENRF|nr:uncharacterized protein LCP9604111_2545 [Penicillium roqueforti]CDM34132.1 Domain of unknown function DUF676, lipase-like [Penicillium roqueforti FM164]KAF9251144.1 hypothetical protein LCP9604111_2545 [Penicillium roqueforti]KAI1837998.1 hypothetical protein CBS147337_1221 [Penicillium roqueforti]KAI2692738.1 hypothetical protein LCP963914a_832 [Penicillium roqueforti]KAI2705661.1 hypothetical protein CBS147372_1964 [Penicillium roqueforti]
MRKTLLLVFIHGFKGGDDTFGTFPEYLRVFASRALPAVEVATAVYPKYETKGDLKECVARLRDWLQDTVIDLEVASHTASPTVDPSVHVVLIGHSMGGIVGADVLLLLAAEQPIPRNTQPGLNGIESIVEPGTFMFPHIQGVLAFDTPFLGIAPGVLSYGAEGHYRTAATAYNTFSEVAGLFGYGGNNASNQGTTHASPKESPKMSPSTPDAAATPSWQRWGKYAMFAGAAGAVAAGGAALYTQRQKLTDGFGWVSSHLEFVGCLARTSELHERLLRLSSLKEERGIGCVNFYTCLGKNATSLVEKTSANKTSFSQKIIRSRNRTFCSLPAEVERGEGSQSPGLLWTRAVNDQATDETNAHITMFLSKENPAFFEMLREACAVLVKSIDKGWYDSSTEPPKKDDIKQPHATEGTKTKTDGDFMDGDDVVVVD